ncbi:MAG TPA: FG-GAP-like repeat-containing protein, partial [Polyangia bacterium]|nr:FG-GAP-like repeat-containing protein [Polyangia bacterium]
GSTPTGGSKQTGGITTTGGVTPTGGGTRPYAGATSTPVTGAPVLRGTINISQFVGTPGMRLGDVNGDGRMEIVIGQPMPQPGAYEPQQVVAVTVYDLTGKQLWQYGTPGTGRGASSDIPIQVYDMDGDGKSEVFAAMSKTEITVIDGPTGKLMRKIPLPQSGSNDCIAFANLRGKGWPQDIVVKTRYSQFWAITGIDDATTKAGTLLWNKKLLASDSSGSDLGTGHYPLIYDWDGDGKDEVMGGYFFFDSDGTQLWTVNTTSSPKLSKHADCLATADVDGNPANGYEIVVGGNVAAMFDWKTGKQLWQDNNTVEVQQMGIGEYRSDSAGLEVVLLDRIGPRDSSGVDANVLLSSTDKLIWKESRKDKGWISVTENMNNWKGDGTDLILSYHRGGSTPASLYDGTGAVVASFPHSNSLTDLVQHADLCGDGKEEVIVYNENSAWIFSNGDCDLTAPPSHPIPQQYHLYNFSEYSGWITPDPKFYTPGTAH